MNSAPARRLRHAATRLPMLAAMTRMPTQNGNVPGCGPDAVQPVPYSLAPTTIAAPSVSVTSAVAVSAANRLTCAREAMAAYVACATRPTRRIARRPSADEPPFLLEHLADPLLVAGDERLDVGAGEEAVRLRRPLDVLLPLRRRADLAEHVDVERDGVGRNALRQPQRARLLVLV